MGRNWASEKSCVPWRKGFGGREAGFTLLELLLVASILVLMTGLLIPRVSRAYRTLQLMATVRGIAAAVDAAAEYSIRYRIDTRLVIDERTSSYWVESDDPNQTAANFEKIDVSVLGDQQYMPTGMTLAVQPEPPVESQGGNYYVRFFPNGRRTPAVLDVIDRRGKKRRVSIGPLVGDLEVSG